MPGGGREPDRRTHLLDVLGARRARLEVDLQPRAHRRVQLALEVVADELDDLAAADTARPDHAATPDAAQVALELAAHLRARAVQQHALVAGSEAERLAHLVGVQAL